MTLNLKFNNPDYPDEKLNKSIEKILSKTRLLSMATINEKESYINTAYFAFNNSLELFLLTPPSSKHSKNLEQNKSVAVTVFDSHQEWNKLKQGLQLFGECEKTTGNKFAEGVRLYLERFPAFGELAKTPEELEKGELESRIYVIKTKWLKVFDEPTFGEDEFIKLKLSE